MLSEDVDIYSVKNEKLYDNTHFFLTVLKVFTWLAEFCIEVLTGLGWVGYVYGFTA